MLAYYAIHSYPIIMLYKIQHKIHAFRVHSSSSQALQYNCTTDYQGCNTVSTVRETDSPPLYPLVPLLTFYAQTTC